MLNRPWQSAGNRSSWTFTGRHEQAVRACLDQLSAWTTEDVDDRWTAAIVYGPVEMNPRFRPARKPGAPPVPPECAWRIEGALALAELLPESLADVRDDLIASFAARHAGQADAS